MNGMRSFTMLWYPMPFWTECFIIPMWLQYQENLTGCETTFNQKINVHSYTIFFVHFVLTFYTKGLPSAKGLSIYASGTFYRKPACMFRARPIQEASAFIVSATILPSIPLRRQNRTDGQRKILCPSCRSILDTMTWMRQKNTWNSAATCFRNI